MANHYRKLTQFFIVFWTLTLIDVVGGSKYDKCNCTKTLKGILTTPPTKHRVTFQSSGTWNLNAKVNDMKKEMKVAISNALHYGSKILEMITAPVYKLNSRCESFKSPPPETLDRSAARKSRANWLDSLYLDFTHISRMYVSFSGIDVDVVNATGYHDREAKTLMEHHRHLRENLDKLLCDMEYLSSLTKRAVTCKTAVDPLPCDFPAKTWAQMQDKDFLIVHSVSRLLEDLKNKWFKQDRKLKGGRKVTTGLKQDGKLEGDRKVTTGMLSGLPVELAGRGTTGTKQVGKLKKGRKNTSGFKQDVTTEAGRKVTAGFKQDGKIKKGRKVKNGKKLKVV